MSQLPDTDHDYHDREPGRTGIRNKEIKMNVHVFYSKKNGDYKTAYKGEVTTVFTRDNVDVGIVSQHEDGEVSIHVSHPSICKLGIQAEYPQRILLIYPHYIRD